MLKHRGVAGGEEPPTYGWVGERGKMEAGEGRDSLSAERHPGRRSPKSDGAGEIIPQSRSFLR